MLEVSEYYDKASPRSTQAGLFFRRVFVFGNVSRKAKMTNEKKLEHISKPII
jgi:hypothetical protein